MAPIENGNLTIPLYHGTSTLSTDSTVQNGLVGADPLVGLGAYDFAQKILPHHRRRSTERGEEPDLLLEKMVDPNLKPGMTRFEYGSVYLTAHEPTARSYASRECGSELIERVMQEYRQLVESEGQSEAIRSLSTHPFLGFVRNSNYRRVLIKAVDIPLSSIKTEGGGNAEKRVREVYKKPDGSDAGHNFDSLHLQFLNFKVVAPIDQSKLELYQFNAQDELELMNPSD